MKTEDLTAAIARHDPLLADAVGKMVGYIQDRWAAPYPSKEQTDGGLCSHGYGHQPVQALLPVDGGSAVQKEIPLPGGKDGAVMYGLFVLAHSL